MTSNASTTRRPTWVGLASLVVAATGLVVVAHSALIGTGGGATFDRSHGVRVNVTTTGLGLPAVPGGEVTVPVTVSNAGATTLRYALTSTVTPATMAAGFELTVKSGVTACTATGFGATGTVVYDGPLGSPAGVKVLGDSTHGAQAGDLVLAPGAADVLCTQVILPVTAGNLVAGLSLPAESFTVNAEAAA